MDEREKITVKEVITLLREDFADDDGEFENGLVVRVVDMLQRLIDPDFDEVPEVSSTVEVPNKLNDGPDYIVKGKPGSTIYQVFPQGNAALVSLVEMVGDDALWFGGSLCVEHRYIEGLVNALRQDGWKVNQ